MYIRRRDMNCSSVAQIVMEGVFDLRKRHITTPLDMEVTVAVVPVSLIQPYKAGSAYFLAASMVCCIAIASTLKPRWKRIVIWLIAVSGLVVLLPQDSK